MNAAVRFHTETCPECGAPAVSVMELCAVTTPLVPLADGYEYDHDGRDFGDIYFNVNAAGEVFLVGDCGHQWRSAFTEKGQSR